MQVKATWALTLTAVFLITACGNGIEADSASTARDGNQDSKAVNGAELTPGAATGTRESGVGAEASVSAVQEITAGNGRFDKELLVVPAGSALQLTFVNEDGLPHNLAVYADEGRTEKVFRGGVITGPVAKEMVSLMAPAAGTYFFFCDAHMEMNGRLIVR